MKHAAPSLAQRVWRGARWAVLAVLALAYLALGYIGSASPHPPLIALLVGFVPLVAIAAVAAWQSRWRFLSLTVLVCAVVVLIWQLTWLRDHSAWMFFIQHAGAMGLLAVTFGATLWGAHADALCSKIALLVTPEHMDAVFLRYTWRVTAAWTLFFVVMAVASVMLFALGSLEAWAFLASVMTPVLVPLVFAVEYVIRLRVLPGHSHLNVWQTIKAYHQHRDAV